MELADLIVCQISTNYFLSSQFFFRILILTLECSHIANFAFPLRGIARESCCRVAWPANAYREGLIFLAAQTGIPHASKKNGKMAPL